MNSLVHLKLAGLLGLIVVLLVGCGSAPTQEMSDARQAIAAAKAAGAGDYSPATMGSAEGLLAEAESLLEGWSYDEARDKAVAAKKEAIAARNMAVAINNAKDALKRASALGFAWRDTGKMIKKAEAAAKKGDERAAVKIAGAATAQSEAAIAQAKREADRYLEGVPSLPGRGDAYAVNKGDNLWRISGKSDIYGNAFQWPMIYKANADQIKDPDLIFPGQSLSISRAFSAVDVDAAISHARNRGAWAVGTVEDSDRAFLGQ